MNMISYLQRKQKRKKHNFHLEVMIVYVIFLLVKCCFVKDFVFSLYGCNFCILLISLVSSLGYISSVQLLSI